MKATLVVSVATVASADSCGEQQVDLPLNDQPPVGCER